MFRDIWMYVILQQRYEPWFVLVSGLEVRAYENSRSPFY